jgi:hypothetical protein
MVWRSTIATARSPSALGTNSSLLDGPDGRKATGAGARRRAKSAFSWDRHIALYSLAFSAPVRLRASLESGGFTHFVTVGRGKHYGVLATFLTS